MKLVLIVAVVMATSACPVRPRDTGIPDTGPCVVDDDPDRVTVAEQGLVAIPPSGLELFLDEDSGGPLRCRPSVDACPAFDDCVGAPVQLPIGVDATLAVGLRTITDGYPGQLIDVTFGEGTGAACTLLPPFPESLPANGGETFIFVGIRPTVEAVITSARLLITTDALNVPAEPLRITLQVEGVAAAP